MNIAPFVKDDFVVLSEEMTISEMIGKFRTQEKRAGLVFRNKKYLGTVAKKHLMKLQLDVTETKIKDYLLRTPVITEDADLIDVAYLMYESSLDFVPVEKDKRIIGVVNALDIAVGSLPDLKEWKVKDAKMIPLAKIKLEKGDAVAEAMTIMHHEHVDQALVFEKKVLYGIISYRDLLRKYMNWSPRRDISVKFNKLMSSKGSSTDVPHLASSPVEGFCTRENLAIVRPNDAVRTAVELMSKNNVTDVIVQDGAVQGLLTVKNVLRLVASLKVPQNFNIVWVGIHDLDLDSEDKAQVQKVASNEAFKLQRRIHNAFNLTIHLKEYNKDHQKGKHKFSVHMRVEYPGRTMTISQDDWDLVTALRKTFENAESALKAKFRGDSSHRKAYE